MQRNVAPLLAIAITALAMPGPTQARPKLPHIVVHSVMREKAAPGLGDYMYGLASGPSWSTEFAVAGRLAALAALGQEGGPNGETGPRLAPLVEESGGNALTDLLTSPTTDLAIVPLPVMDAAARANPLLKSRVGYVAPLYLETVHVVAKAGVPSVEALRGKRVALGDPNGVGASMFNALGIPIQSVTMTPTGAVDALRSGAVDAAVLVSGDPVPALSGIPADAGLHLVPVSYVPALDAGFLPTKLSKADSPTLIDSDAVPAVAVQAVLAAYLRAPRTERAQSLGALVWALLDHIGTPGVTSAGDRLKDVNWAATLPGWTRLPTAQAWLDARAKAASAPANAHPSDEAVSAKP